LSDSCVARCRVLTTTAAAVLGAVVPRIAGVAGEAMIGAGQPAVEARDLVKRFGETVAVDARSARDAIPDRGDEACLVTPSVGLR
jgi:hypothetical protein